MRVAALQLASGPDKPANLARIAHLIARAATEHCRLVALPEVANVRGRTAADQAEPVDGPTLAFLTDQARRHGMWILGGSLLERPANHPVDGHVYNTSPLIDPDGRIAAVYRKLHLFDVEISDGPSFKESDRVRPGDRLVLAHVDGVPVGLSVCYDLRFPELYRLLTIAGARILFVPAAFTTHTGRAHWEVLLRARAIENQTYVVAPAQVGPADDGSDCFGHTMIVDPWGRVLAHAPDDVAETLVVTDLDLADLERIRSELPSLRNRRPDVYRDPAAAVS